ncbi:REP-associated tyrosine transposase [Geminocystis sp. CENA526]|uniref:REP-associated tyrosine transposase n=1 Tax=Geminocystis sp. CENA526 TaxID=1355871 RepID=UPI003D6F1071
MEYRRTQIQGGTYFFTVVTYNRHPILCYPDNIQLLREAFAYAMKRYPFIIDAIVILPDHLHCIWTLPEGDGDFSTRWRLIKSYFSRKCERKYQGQISKSRQKKQEKAIWQRRFWEHFIRDEQDFINHVDYIHYNPVHHGLVKAVKDWQYSSFDRYVKQEMYDRDWGISENITFDDNIGKE